MQICPYKLNSMFLNLTYLELALDFPPSIGKLKWSWLKILLSYFPKLQTLVIDEVFNVSFCPVFFYSVLLFYIFYIFRNISIVYHCQVDTTNNFGDESWVEP